MIGRYAILAGRIRQELAELARVVDRVERASRASQRPTPEQDLFYDAAALNLHDFYAGLERIFAHVASEFDHSIPTGTDWHRQLLRQMTLEVPSLRPPVLPTSVADRTDEYLRFRHVVRHIYAFELDPERVQILALGVRPLFQDVQTSLLTFADFLEDLAHQA